MSTSTSALRRAPVQQRSAARVERMLDAAAALLDEVGYEGTTTSAIAARAGVSVGSLYQFFPDRRAVLQALALRSFERFTAVLATRVEAARPASWQDGVDLVVDAYVEFAGSEPAARVLSFGGPVDRRMLDPAADNSTVVADALGGLLGLEPTPQLRLALRVAVEATDGVLGLAFRAAPGGDPVVVDQAKRMVKAYLGEHL